MIGELFVSRSNERWLLAHGAASPPDAAYPVMRWAYPGAFGVMAAEGVARGGPFPSAAVAGAVLLLLSKALKSWAIVALGRRWTYRVLVIPGEPLVSSGPYRVLRHPNYVAVVGELLSMLLLTAAWITGPLGIAAFLWLLARRIRDEERALDRGD
jgi:methyltransferase